MSDREYLYFMKKDNECSEYMEKYSGTADRPTTTTNKEADEINCKDVTSLIDQNSKMLSYQTSIKDSAITAILAFLVPSAGQMDTGNLALKYQAPPNCPA